jgi:hypothetical protein
VEVEAVEEKVVAEMAEEGTAAVKGWAAVGGLRQMQCQSNVTNVLLAISTVYLLGQILAEHS